MSKNENLDITEKQIDLKNYDAQPGSGLKSLDFGLWVAEHRQQMIKMVIIVLILVSAGLFIYSSYGFFVYFTSGDPNAQISTEGPATLPSKLINDLEVSQIMVFENDTKSDLVVQIVNPNEKYLANFNYCFKSGEATIFCGQGFILPNEKKNLMTLATELKGNRSDMTFSLDDIFWRRIDPHKISNWTDFYNQRINFPVSDLNFREGNSSGLSDKLRLNTLDFVISNETAYSYYDVPLNILLYSGSTLIGVNRYPIINFLAGEKRQVNISWTGSLSFVNRTEVVPDLNIMDENSYLLYRGSGAN